MVIRMISEMKEDMHKYFTGIKESWWLMFLSYLGNWE
jgi:hypothetical protein